MDNGKLTELKCTSTNKYHASFGDKSLLGDGDTLHTKSEKFFSYLMHVVPVEASSPIPTRRERASWVFFILFIKFNNIIYHTGKLSPSRQDSTRTLVNREMVAKFVHAIIS